MDLQPPKYEAIKVKYFWMIYHLKQMHICIENIFFFNPFLHDKMWWNDLNIAKLRWWNIIFNLHSSVSLEMSTWEEVRVGTCHQPQSSLPSPFCLCTVCSSAVACSSTLACRLIRGCLEFYSGTVMPHPPGHHRKDTPISGLAHSWSQSSCIKVLFYISNSLKGQLFYQVSSCLHRPPTGAAAAARLLLISVSRGT